MKSFLKFVDSPKAPKSPEFEIPPGRSIFLGRRATCDLLLEDSMIAPVHCLVTLMPQIPDRLILVDLGGTNGTWMGDKKVTTEILKPGDEFSIAKTWRFRFLMPSQP